MEDDVLYSGGSKVVRLKDTKEVKRLLTSQEPIMVVVYAKWCGHCQQMFKPWNKLSKDVEGKSKVYVIESADYTGKDIDGYPDIRIVKNGEAKQYDGGRDVQSMKKALLGSLGGKRRRTNRLGGRVRKIAKRTLRRNVTFV
jgi:thiol-disulfide isomerase/thioredoxin